MFAAARLVLGWRAIPWRGQRCGVVGLVGRELWRRSGVPHLSKTLSSPRSGLPSRVSSPEWIMRWWAPQTATRLWGSVGPPSSQCQMWWMISQRRCSQPGTTQPPSRCSMARRKRRLARRWRRPRPRVWLASSTQAVRSASQQTRRRTVSEMDGPRCQCAARFRRAREHGPGSGPRGSAHSGWRDRGRRGRGGRPA